MTMQRDAIEAAYRAEVIARAESLFLRWSQYGIPEEKHVEIAMEAFSAAEAFTSAREAWAAGLSCCAARDDEEEHS